MASVITLAYSLGTAVAIFSGLDRQFQTFVLSAFPEYGTGLKSIEEQDFVKEELEKRNNTRIDYDSGGPLYNAIKKGGAWINSGPVDPASLEGKVVLIDFWTYSCINCIHTLPYLTAWDAAYRDKGLVIIGVHSPEFAFEREENNVRAAVKAFAFTFG